MLIGNQVIQYLVIDHQFIGQTYSHNGTAAASEWEHIFQDHVDLSA